MYEHPQEATVGDGAQVQLLGIGSIDTISKINELKCNLENVALVPSLATNLLSVRAAAKSGIDTLFSGERCVMSKDRQELLNGTGVGNGLYIMNMETCPRIERELLISGPQDLNELHRAL